MKLASLKSRRDGRLVVVSRDLTRAVAARLHRADAAGGARRLGRCRAGARGAGGSGWNADCPSRAFRFREHDCASPLPRAYQWADGSAYVNHVALVRKARGAEMPATFWTDPLMYQGGSDAFLGPRDPIPLLGRRKPWPRSRSRGRRRHRRCADGRRRREEARDAHRLVMLVNDVTLRGLVAAELAKGFGFFQSKPSSAFSPVAVTPDELGDAWDGGEARPAAAVLRQRRAARPAERRRRHDLRFRRLIAHAARTRALSAGTIIGSGTVSNRGRGGGPGKPVSQGRRRLFLHRRAARGREALDGAPRTPFLKPGDTVAHRNARCADGAIDFRRHRAGGASCVRRGVPTAALSLGAGSSGGSPFG